MIVHFVLLIVALVNANLTTPITSVFRDPDSPLSTDTVKVGAIDGSLGYCVDSSGLYDAHIGNEYYCNMAPLFDEWQRQQKVQYCYIGVGQFIAPPDKNGTFFPTENAYNMVNIIAAHTEADMEQVFFPKYPQVIYAGSHSDVHPDTGVYNTVALMTLELGNATAFYKDWKNNAHHQNIVFATNASFGSPWKGKIVPCSEIQRVSNKGVWIADQASGAQYIAGLQGLTNRFDLKLLAEAVERGKAGGVAVTATMGVGMATIKISNVPQGSWFAVGYTPGGMAGTTAVLFDSQADMGRPVKIKDHTQDTMDFSGTLADIGFEVESIHVENGKQHATLMLKLKSLKGLKLVYAFGQDTETFGYHGGNKKVLDLFN